jgi:ribonuclease R
VNNKKKTKEENKKYKENIRKIVRSKTSFDFPNNLKKELSSINSKINNLEIKKRRDFREDTTFTIDPYDAKDFDDAISIKKISEKVYEVGVHIADVSFFVKEGSKIDDEGYRRGTSIYLVDKVIPMLPEEISNNLCSLLEHKDRLTFSIVFKFKENNIINVWYGKGIINSNKRFTYEEAYKILKDKKGRFFNELNTLNEIAKSLFEKRKDNSLLLAESEIKIVLDKNGYPIKIDKKERVDTHKLVEEFMLLSNKSVASLFEKETFVYRIHDKPEKEKINILKNISLEYKINVPDKINNKILNSILESIKNPELKSLFSRLVTKTMAKALYSSKNIGHFGLGFKNYTHFTSPIRRYPDIIAHRLLEEKISNKKNKLNKKYFESSLQYLSEKEREAVDFERTSQKDFLMIYMSKHIESKRNGRVSGILENGIFIEDIESTLEGFIYKDELNKNFKYNEKGNFWKSKHNDKKIKIGDMIDFRIKKINFERSLVDYSLII